MLVFNKHCATALILVGLMPPFTVLTHVAIVGRRKKTDSNQYRFQDIIRTDP